MPESPADIFLDTSALKYAADRLIRGYRVPKTVAWGDAAVTIPMGRWYEVYPNDKLHWRQRWETTLLPFVAWLAVNGRVRLLYNTEVKVEFWGLPRTDDPRGQFYGAPIERVKAPITYGRIIAGGFPGMQVKDGETLRYPTMSEHQLNFLAGLQHQRFLQLQKATGAYQGAHERNVNQLLDAFHIWCAEGAGADYFLTLDQKLLRHLKGHRAYPPKVHCVSPRQLVACLEKSGVVSWRDLLKYLPLYARQVRKPQTSHPLEDLVTMTRHLDKAERRARWKRWFGAA